jgi:hypothetical protein
LSTYTELWYYFTVRFLFWFSVALTRTAWVCYFLISTELQRAAICMEVAFCCDLGNEWLCWHRTCVCIAVYNFSDSFGVSVSSAEVNSYSYLTMCWKLSVDNMDSIYPSLLRLFALTRVLETGPSQHCRLSLRFSFSVVHTFRHSDAA